MSLLRMAAHLAQAVAHLFARRQVTLALMCVSLHNTEDTVFPQEAGPQTCRLSPEVGDLLLSHTSSSWLYLSGKSLTHFTTFPPLRFDSRCLPVSSHLHGNKPCLPLMAMTSHSSKIPLRCLICPAYYSLHPLYASLLFYASPERDTSTVPGFYFQFTFLSALPSSTPGIPRCSKLFLD